jgi:molecular chaperone DnaK
VEARNQLDSLVYQVEKDSGEWGDKLSSDSRTRLESAVEKAKEALKGDDAAALNAARDELMQAFSAAGQEMYQAQAAETGASQPDMDDMGAEPPDSAQADAGGGEADEEVVEADYEIVDEEK